MTTRTILMSTLCLGAISCGDPEPLAPPPVESAMEAAQQRADEIARVRAEQAEQAEQAAVTADDADEDDPQRAIAQAELRRLEEVTRREEARVAREQQALREELDGLDRRAAGSWEQAREMFEQSREQLEQQLAWAAEESTDEGRPP